MKWFFFFFVVTTATSIIAVRKCEWNVSLSFKNAYSEVNAFSVSLLTAVFRDRATVCNVFLSKLE